jgi:hypothetical protein
MDQEGYAIDGRAAYGLNQPAMRRRRQGGREKDPPELSPRLERGLFSPTVASVVVLGGTRSRTNVELIRTPSELLPVLANLQRGAVIHLMTESTLRPTMPHFAHLLICRMIACGGFFPG